jgi:hypothetical protein
LLRLPWLLLLLLLVVVLGLLLLLHLSCRLLLCPAWLVLLSALC